MQRTNGNTNTGVSQPRQHVLSSSPVPSSVSDKPVLDLKELQAFECKLWDYQHQLRAGGVKYGSLQEAWTKFIHQYNATSYGLEKNTRTRNHNDGQIA